MVKLFALKVIVCDSTGTLGMELPGDSGEVKTVGIYSRKKCF